MAPKLKEAKELSKLKTAQFYQHPQAFVLDPEYQKLQEDHAYFKMEADHWQEQLLAMSEGKDWVPLVGWNKDGTPRYGQPQKTNKVAEEQVRMAMNQMFAQSQQALGNLQAFPARYQQQIQQDNVLIQEECAKRFGWVGDPKVLDATIETGAGNKTVKQVREDFINLFPAYQRNTVGVDVAAHLFAALQIYGQEIRELREGKKVAEIKKEEVTRAEPTSEVRPAAEGKTIGGVREFNLDLMPV